ncbi:MAG: DUF6634 family protein [Mesorhizobium sp.]
MLTFDPRSRIQDGAFNNGLTRMAALVADIERIASGVSPGELARDVPILDHWSVNHRAIPCLVGLSTGHPALPGVERPIVTSDLWMLSTDLLWARTLSRWYRLGRPAVGAVPNQ